MGKYDNLKPNTSGVFASSDSDRVMVAVKLLLKGHSVTMVAKATGLKESEVKALQERANPRSA